ncbi:MAG: hypothetical protein A2383_00925 [Candidatus Pacebacteria bacterium RIFOXYB1_FULL_39_46]|nr:MAG: hypothetical protein A2182_00760 [Candidatus Pacebacteria bacterium RIFOXYA1_FULL_38_18]OGJ38145.1 MAG: hypothetical protein A2383_00925 [Candidatus Pacebacteria bacterium RIFOXYB1_FULL_39_46]OGJ39633.1 MAG: hypothetical protein A2411_02515 [Candidatus Pacebacteria bacterium RIFOXYC1_FULL_39_21]OGJ39897.1 MAG: hypothetical protein A2582_00690 [Candidatus Pacebacteria bacterium RIFOXYD1_FULL_39_27]
MTPITGLPQVNGWAQVITHPSRALTCVLSVIGKNANSVGKTLAEQISHFKVINSAQLHNDLLDLLQSARREDCRLQLACILQSEDKNIIATHSGSVFLRRQGRVGEILSSQGNLKIIEGSKVSKDLFVLATEQSTIIFPELKILLQRDTESLVTQLVAELQNQENSSLSALAWIEDGLVEPKETINLTDQPKKLLKQLNPKLFSQTIQKIKLLRWPKNPLFLVKKSWRKIKNIITSGSKPRMGSLNQLSKRTNYNFWLGAGLIIVLLLSLILWKKHQINQEIQALQPKLGELEQQLESAQSIAENDPIMARNDAKEVIKGLEDLIAGNQDKPQALKRLKQNYQEAQDFVQSITSTQLAGPLDPFFDLRLTEADFVAQQIALNEDTLFTLDAAGQKIVTLDLDTKQTTQIPLENIGTARALAVSGETIYVLADGIYAYDLSGETRQETRLKEQGDSDRAGNLLGLFATYLYIINPEERNIYRYLKNTEGLSEPIGWLVDKQNLEFNSITDLAIDGDVWLTTKSGELLKYTQGRPQNFTVNDLSIAFDSELKIATHPDSEYLFVLERARQRLVVLSKDGSFFKEIISESLATVDTIAASLSENAVFAVSGSLVYKISF